MAYRDLGNRIDPTRTNNEKEMFKELYNLVDTASKKAKSAYDLWIEQGNKGTISDFLNSQQGKTAYELAVENGYVGTMSEWLASLKGKDAVINDNSITPEKTSFIKTGKNLFNKNDIIPNKVIGANNGGLADSSSYHVSHYIYLKQGEQVIVTHYRNYEFFDVNMNFVKYDGTAGINAVITAPVDGYLRMSIYPGDYLNLQVERGTTQTSYEAFKYVMDSNINVYIPPLDIKDSSLTPDKMSFITTGKNLFNINDVSNDTLINNNGTIGTSTTYAVTEKILLKSGQAITISKMRNLAFYDMNDNFVYFYGTASTNYTYTAPQDGYVRYSLYKTDLPTIQIELGTAATTYEPYTLYLSDKVIVGGSKIDKSFKYSIVKTGENFDLKTLLNNKELLIKTVRNGSQNNSFNFNGDYYDGKSIHSTTDDITPVRLPAGTVGANHGYPVVFDLALNGKTASDLGSVWTDGTTQYVLLRIVNSRLIFGSPYDTSGGYTSAALKTPTADLTHVSGATNTATVPIAGIVTTTQLYPSTGKVKVEYKINGTSITEDGIYKADEVEVFESYEIIDYKAIIDWSKSNKGKDYATVRDSLQGTLAITNNFTFYDHGSCTVSTGFKPLQTTLMGRSGTLQSVALTHPTYPVYRYVPNLKAMGSVDFTQPIALANYNSTNYVTVANLIDATKPVDRYVDYIVNGSTPEIAFSMGYVIDKTNSKHADRLANVSSTLWDFRSTKKSYPSVLESKLVNSSDYFTFEGYRNYFIPKNGAVLNNLVKDKSDRYVYIDELTAKTYNSQDYADLIGGRITIIESKDFTLKSEIVDANGINYSISAAKGYAILKIV